MPKNSRHLAWLYSQLPEWQEKGWLAPNASEAIQSHYGPVEESDYRRLTSILFASLAALLIGGGVILIFAHNWDEISRPLRAVLSIFPLLITYLLGAYTLRRKVDSVVWREGVAVGNVCALAAAIGLIAQTYNISGNLSSFLLTVGILSLPTVYLFRSVGASALYLAGLVWRRWAAVSNWFNPDSNAYLTFWIMLALLVPFLFMLARDGRKVSIKWLIFGILAAIAIILPPENVGFLGITAAYAMLCSSVIGFRVLDRDGTYIGRMPVVFAHAGLVVILMILSFSDCWNGETFYRSGGDVSTIILLSSLGLISCALLADTLYLNEWLSAIWSAIGPCILGIMLFSRADAVGVTGSSIINLFALAVGGASIGIGYVYGRMSQVNVGLTVVGGIFLMRFFDSDWPMVYRGGCFIVIGLAFILVNVKLSRKFKKERVS